MAQPKHINNSIGGFGYLLKGLSLLGKPGVKRFVIIPLLINIVLFAVLIWLASDYFQQLVNYLLSFLPSWLEWLSKVLWLLFTMLAGLIMFFSFSFVANIVGAPFNSYLAAAVEKHLTGSNPIGSERGLWAEFGETMLGELKKWGYYALWAIPLFIISWFIAPIAPFLWFLFGAWMFSIEYLDYPMGNYGLTFPDIRKQIASQRLLTLSFGSAVTVATMIPICNFIVMPVAVAGATAMRVDRFPIKKES
jgi:CysZ protein